VTVVQELKKEQQLAADALFSLSALKQTIVAGFRQQKMLGETFCIALALHVFAFPMIWCMGWALPFPKSPVTTTVIIFDLQKWAKEEGRLGKLPKVVDIREPERNR
jgi:hypothetical protein